MGPGDKFRGKISRSVWKKSGIVNGPRLHGGACQAWWIIMAFSLCKGTGCLKRGCTVQRITTRIGFCCCLRGRRRQLDDGIWKLKQFFELNGTEVTGEVMRVERGREEGRIEALELCFDGALE